MLANDRLYIATQEGTVYVVAASPHRFELLAENPSGNSIYATPVAIDDRIYLRTAVQQAGDRQEFLVAIGRKTQQP